MKKWWGIILILYIQVSAFCQIQWDGEGDGVSWNDAANWRPDAIPAQGSVILLNNIWINSNYQVRLPAGDVSVTVTSLEITPASGKVIELINPSENLSATAFIANGEGDAVIINEGGIIRNASGAAAGTPVGVTTTNFFRINNGGRYIHNCPRGHTATLVARLSSVAGTEEGVFEFDVPSASFPISLSARTYGKLVLSSATHGNPVTYFASGSQHTRIQGDLQLNEQVNLTLDMNTDIQVNGNFHIKHGSVCNLSNSTNNTRVKVMKDLLLDGTLTETGSGLPGILLQGTALQVIKVTGFWTNSINLNLDNFQGAVLQHDLTLSHSLSLTNGNFFLGQYNLFTPVIHQVGVTSPTNNHLVSNGSGMLTLPGIGVNPVVFPVGAASDQYTPIIIQHGHGANYAVRVEPGFPITIFDPAKAVLNTWIVRSSLTLPADISFGFYVPENTGGLFNVHATVDAGIYINGWNVFARAIQPVQGEGSIYWATTTMYSLTSDDNYPLVLGNAGSILSKQNSLICRMSKNNGRPVLTWEYLDDSLTRFFEVQRTDNGEDFQPVALIPFHRLQESYSWMDNIRMGSANYRIRIVKGNADILYSNIVSFIPERLEPTPIKIYPNPADNKIIIQLPSELNGKGELVIFDVQGKIVMKKEYKFSDQHLLDLDIGHFSAGIYLIRCMLTNKDFECTGTFIKK